MDERDKQVSSHSHGMLQRLVSLITPATLVLFKPMNLILLWFPSFQRFFNSLIKSIEAQALKPVTLGHPVPLGGGLNCSDTGSKMNPGARGGTLLNGVRLQADAVSGSKTLLDAHITSPGSSSHDTEGDSISSRDDIAAPENLQCLKGSESCQRRLESLNGQGTKVGAASDQKQEVPKKSVGFSDTAEVMETGSKKDKKKKKKAAKRLASASAVFNDAKAKELRPLRSILKVNSDVNQVFG